MPPKGDATYDLIVEAHMPNLENLKKQAKLILRWHRDGHYPVAPQIRAHLPRFLNIADAEILAANFKLADAQQLVARQQGFETWQSLTASLSATPSRAKSLPSKSLPSKSSPSKAAPSKSLPSKSMPNNASIVP